MRARGHDAAAAAACVQLAQQRLDAVEGEHLRSALLRQALPAVHDALGGLSGKAKVGERLPSGLAEGRAQLLKGIVAAELVQRLLQALLIHRRRIEKRSVYIKNKIFHAFSSSQAVANSPAS